MSYEAPGIQRPETTIGVSALSSGVGYKTLVGRRNLALGGRRFGRRMILIQRVLKGIILSFSITTGWRPMPHREFSRSPGLYGASRIKRNHWLDEKLRM